jgi:serine/threonine protein kinase
MVCGTLPFIDEDTGKLFKKIISGIYRPISGVSDDLKDLLSKMLVVKPKNRINLS